MFRVVLGITIVTASISGVVYYDYKCRPKILRTTPIRKLTCYFRKPDVLDIEEYVKSEDKHKMTTKYYYNKYNITDFKTLDTQSFLWFAIKLEDDHALSYFYDILTKHSNGSPLKMNDKRAIDIVNMCFEVHAKTSDKCFLYLFNNIPIFRDNEYAWARLADKGRFDLLCKMNYYESHTPCRFYHILLNTPLDSSNYDDKTPNKEVSLDYLKYKCTGSTPYFWKNRQLIKELE